MPRAKGELSSYAKIAKISPAQRRRNFIFPLCFQMALPYRFKAGGSPDRGTKMAPISATSHHHRSTTKQAHKPFKPRFAGKGALKDLAKGSGYFLSWVMIVLTC